MRMKSRILGVATAMSLFLGLMALPAAAYDVVVFTGTATVCADTNTGKSAAPGCPDPTKQNGLYLVGHPDVNGSGTSKWLGRHGNYSFSSGNFEFGNPPECLKFNPLGDTAPVDCSIAVDGTLAPAAGVVGAACGMSEGNSGIGAITAANGSVAAVSQVGWPATAGGTLPIKGNYDFTSGPKNAAKNSSGQFYGVVQAQGGADCVKLTNDHGASTFNVVGVAVMTPAPKKP